MAIHDETTQLRRPKYAFPLSVAFGTGCGLMVFVFTLIFGSHGGLPSVGNYVLGPPILLFQLNVDEVVFLLTLGIATCLLWIGYWWFALRGGQRFSLKVRLLLVAVFHVVTVAIHQLTFGLP